MAGGPGVALRASDRSTRSSSSNAEELLVGALRREIRITKFAAAKPSSRIGFVLHRVRL